MIKRKSINMVKRINNRFRLVLLRLNLIVMCCLFLNLVRKLRVNGLFDFGCSYYMYRRKILFFMLNFLINGVVWIGDICKVVSGGIIRFKKYDEVVRFLINVKYILFFKKNFIFLIIFDSMGFRVLIGDGVLYIIKGFFIVLKG